MKIGIIASIWISNPPQGFGFGAQEYLTYQLAEGLKKKGHEVTLFASGDSKTSVNLVSVTPAQVMDLRPADNRIKDVFELLNVSQAYKMVDKFDIFHNHLLPYGMLFADLFPVPTVHTLHHQIYHDKSDYHLYDRYKEQKFITISNAQRKIMTELNYVGTVYNGIDANYYNFKEKPEGNYLLYIGRLKKYKGIHTAIAMARKTGLELKIATPLPNPSQPDYDEVNEYWEKDIKSQLGGSIEHTGVLKGKEKVSMLSNAKALIFPIEREEPFGMTLIEAMACGTPVIAYNRGAMPEIITDGESGFLVDSGDNVSGNYIIKTANFDGLCEAGDKLNKMSEDDYLSMRKKSRLRVENSFTVENMVNKYEEIYLKYI